MAALVGTFQEMSSLGSLRFERISFTSDPTSHCPILLGVFIAPKLKIKSQGHSLPDLQRAFGMLSIPNQR